MASLPTKIKLYVESNNKTVDFNPLTGNVLVQNIGNGDEIANWNIEGLEQPTDAQLNVLETQADDYEFNLGQIAKRKAEYGTAEKQMENIIENGLEAEQTRVNNIKTKYPKR